MIGSLMLSLLTISISAEENYDEDQYISLPVDIIDFDQDSLFFEYLLGSGLELLVDGGNASDENGTKYQTGLVEQYLKDGKLVYKQETVERTARIIGN